MGSLRRPRAGLGAQSTRICGYRPYNDSVSEPSAVEILERLGLGFALDRLWRETMGLPPGDTKEQPLRSLVAVLEACGTRYAVIGGVAMQLYSREPRTTLDIDLAVTK